MDFTINNRQSFIGYLEAHGLEKKLFSSFMRSIKICFDDDPELSHIKANKQLRFLGWDDIDLDYHALQLAKYFLKQKELKPNITQK